jgi:hypothetical protein
MMEIAERVFAFIVRLPPLLLAFIILCLGWAGAHLSRLLVSGLLSLARLDRIAERTGFAEFLRKGNVRYSASKLGGVIGYWLVLVATFVGIAKILDVELVSSLADRFKALLPGIIAAIFVITVGFIVVAFIANSARTIARNAAVPNSGLIARSIKYIGNFIVVLMALDQMDFGSSLLSTMALLLFAAIVLGFALAFGLGCKDLAGKAFAKFLRTLRERDREAKGTDLEG